MYRVSTDLQKHDWKVGRTRNDVGTRATGECFHSFFELGQLSNALYYIIHSFAHSSIRLSDIYL